MRCAIADLIVEIPEVGGMAPRCREYLTNDTGPVDVEIRQEDYDLSLWKTDDYNMACYMETGSLFYTQLMKFNATMLHASAVSLDGRAYLFSGPSGVGKSTHTRLWQQCFAGVEVFNDDKPALRNLDGRWFAYGTPWSGKHGINCNRKVPLAGICFLKQGTVNRIRRLSPMEAVPLIYGQTYYKLSKRETVQQLLTIIDALVRSIPIYELENRPEEAAALLSRQTMLEGAQSIGL